MNYYQFDFPNVILPHITSLLWSFSGASLPIRLKLFITKSRDFHILALTQLFNLSLPLHPLPPPRPRNPLTCPVPPPHDLAVGPESSSQWK